MLEMSYCDDIDRFFFVILLIESIFLGFLLTLAYLVGRLFYTFIGLVFFLAYLLFFKPTPCLTTEGTRLALDILESSLVRVSQVGSTFLPSYFILYIMALTLLPCCLNILKVKSSRF